MKIKTSELVDEALDWAVAQCEGVKVHPGAGGGLWVCDPNAYGGSRCIEGDAGRRFCPSTDWSQGGPIIERVGINLKQDQPPGYPPYGWSAWCPARKSTYYGEGPTPLIAAMRCYVASKLSGWV